MISLIDQWYDWWRLGILLIAVIGLLFLMGQFVKCRKVWGEKKRDEWFVKVMWLVAAGEMQIEGILRDTELRVRLVFVTMAVILTLKLLTKKYKRDEDA